jgi:GTP cyclohydrolase II
MAMSNPAGDRAGAILPVPANAVKGSQNFARQPDSKDENGSSVRVRRQVEIPIGRPAFMASFVTFFGLPDGREHFAVCTQGQRQIADRQPPLVRVHSECMTGDIFGSALCDCGFQLADAIERARTQASVIIYLRQEGRGIGLYGKLDAYALQQSGLDTFEANRALGYADDERSFGVAALMLRALGIDRIRLLTNNPRKATELCAAGVEVTEILATRLHLTGFNGRYLAAKKSRHGHTLPDLVPAPGSLEQV